MSPTAHIGFYLKKTEQTEKNKLENQNQETNTIKTKKLRKSMR